MKIPKFLIADNSALKETIFIVHTEYPRFILNVINDEVFWLEEFENDDKIILDSESRLLIEEALVFYDKEMESLD